MNNFISTQLQNATMLLAMDRFLGIRTKENLFIWLEQENLDFNLETRHGWEQAANYILNLPYRLPSLDLMVDNNGYYDILLNRQRVCRVRLKINEDKFEVSSWFWYTELGRRRFQDVTEFLVSRGHICCYENLCDLSCLVRQLYFGEEFGQEVFQLIGEI